MIPIDAIGNPINKEDLVSIQRGDQSILGVVVDIKEPSLLSPGTSAEMQQVGVVVVSPIPMTLPFTAQQPRFSDVIKVVKPPTFGKRPS